MSLSLCMIVKNEEDNLARCLKSVKDMVDEIIIVDTGSTDETVRIAKSFGAKTYEYKWNDSFADARNYSLSKANGDWILIMDGDDEFERADKGKLLAIIERDTPGAEVFCCKTFCFSGAVPDMNNVLINLNARLIKNHLGYKFRGRIHEQVVLKEETSDLTYPMLATDIRFYHYGYLTSNITKQNKHTRNIALIEKELAEKPEDCFMLFNMGNEYLALGETEKALDFYMRSFKKFHPEQGFSSMLLTRIILCNEQLHQESELFKFIKLGLQYYPQITDFEYIKGFVLLKQKKVEKAIRSYKKCIKMGVPPVNVISGAGVATFKPHYALSTIYVTLGDYDKAFYHCRKAIKYNPVFREALAEMADLLMRKGRTAKAVKSQMAKLIPHTNDSYLMLSDIFYDRKLYQQALELAVQAESCSPESPIVYYYEGICKFYLKKYKQAYECLLKADTDAFCSKSAFFRLLCTFFDAASAPAPLSDFVNKIDKPYYKVTLAFQSFLRGKSCEALSANIADSQKYIKPIFDLLDILLKTQRLEDFQKALELLNLISDKKVLMLLGKLYYRNGYTKLAYDEFKQSIKLTDNIDEEALVMMKNSFRAAAG